MKRQPALLLLLLAALLLPIGMSVGGSASAQSVPSSRADLTYSFSSVVKKTAPAVVNIYTRRVVQARNVSPLFNDPFFQQFFGNDFGGTVPQQRVQNSLGSGVILRADGLIVTNNHVIKNSDQITVVLSDRREYPAHVMLADERIDLALLKIDPGKTVLPTLPLADSDQIEVGDFVLAIGNPFGLGQTVTSGIISALGRSPGIEGYEDFIQTDASINPGNSGGPLVDLQGRIVGINTAIVAATGANVGIGFAVPINMARLVMDQLISGGEIKHGHIGVAIQDLTPDIAQALGTSRTQGAVIAKVMPGSPAERAGLRSSDLVIAVNGTPIHNGAELKSRVGLSKVGDSVDLTILRGGAERTVAVRVDQITAQRQRVRQR